MEASGGVVVVCVCACVCVCYDKCLYVDLTGCLLQATTLGLSLNASVSRGKSHVHRDVKKIILINLKRLPVKYTHFSPIRLFTDIYIKTYNFTEISKGSNRWASEGVDMLGRCRSAFYPVHTHSECSSVCLTGRPSFLLLIK